jgi:hypothetical protein
MKVLEDDGELWTVKDRFGWTARKYKNHSSSMRFLDHAVKTRKDWDAFKGGMVLNPRDPSRLDSESYYIHFNPYPSWEGSRVIYDAYRRRGKYLMFACYGPWEFTWRHHGYEDTLMDLIAEPEWMEEMFEWSMDNVIAILKHCLFLVENNMPKNPLTGSRGSFGSLS